MQNDVTIPAQPLPTMYILWTERGSEYTIDIDRKVTLDGELVGHYLGNAEAGLFLAVTADADRRATEIPVVGKSIQMLRLDGEKYTSTRVETVFTQDELFPSDLFPISA